MRNPKNLNDLLVLAAFFWKKKKDAKNINLIICILSTYMHIHTEA